MTKSVAIVGAGIGGLASGLLLQSLGYQVEIFEAHSLPGGCAGFYRRGPYQFDVGATTVSGLVNNGVLAAFLDQLQLKYNFQKADPGIVFYGSWGSIERSSSTEQWIKNLEKKFPELDHRRAWEKIDAFSAKSWNLFTEVHHFPPKSLTDLVMQIDSSVLSKLTLVPQLLTSFSNFLGDYLKNEELKRLIDQLLLISTQSLSHQVPALVGCLGATYPADTWYPEGGVGEFLKFLANSFKQRGGKIYFKTKIEKISYKVDYKLKSQRGDFGPYHQLVLSAPIWNNEFFFEGKIKDYFSKKSSYFDQAWGAMTGYGVYKGPPIHQLYHQVHLDNENSMFFSFSHPGDLKRAPMNEQVFSVSTHIDVSKVPSKFSDPDGYNEFKLRFRNDVERALQKIQVQLSDFELESIGTPQTFEFFTHRYRGYVGGIPQNFDFPLWNFMGHRTPFEGLWLVGDTVFPGQGIVGVVGGAKMLSSYFK